MKLECDDVRALSWHDRYCECRESWGHYETINALTLEEVLGDETQTQKEKT